MHTFPFREYILGPPSNEKIECNKFKLFWGNDIVRSKRFSDGTLLDIIHLNNESMMLSVKRVPL